MRHTRKKIIRVFQGEGLPITSKCNLSRTNFLDVCFDLKEKTYIQYCKPNNTPFYIHECSNHPPIVKKHLPQEYNNTAFEKTAPEYIQALQRSGFKHTIMYKPLQSPPPPHTVAITTKKKRKRNWFNPPFSENVARNIKKKIFSLLSQRFPPTTKDL